MVVDANEKAAEAFEVIGTIANVLSTRTGPFGIGAIAVATISSAIATAIRNRGLTVQEILDGISEPPDPRFPWDVKAPEPKG